MKEKSDKDPHTLIFVYGSLKRGFQRHKVLTNGGAQFAGAGITFDTNYTMHTLDAFPAVIQDGKDNSRFAICGELYTVNKNVLDTIDAVESDGLLFSRKLIEVFNLNDANNQYKVTRAWMYLWTRTNDLPMFPGQQDVSIRTWLCRNRMTQSWSMKAAAVSNETVTPSQIIIPMKSSQILLLPEDATRIIQSPAILTKEEKTIITATLLPGNKDRNQINEMFFDVGKEEIKLSKIEQEDRDEETSLEEDYDEEGLIEAEGLSEESDDEIEWLDDEEEDDDEEDDEGYGYNKNLDDALDTAASILDEEEEENDDKETVQQLRQDYEDWWGERYTQNKVVASEREEAEKKKIREMPMDIHTFQMKAS
jgi:gamma-glutamylcyclotransferase (GGCT)/AIG2-like uncharacterized protein YtfP